MKNIGASVDAVPAQEKEVEEEKYTQMENEMVFYLRENPSCQIYAIGEWCENSRGEVIGDVDTYFLHILTGRRCESAWGCLVGWSEQDKKTAEDWETLCQHIEDLPSLEQIICDEKRVEVWKNKKNKQK